MSGPWEAYATQMPQDGPWTQYATSAAPNTTPGGLPSAQVNIPNAAQNVMTNPNLIMPQPGSQVEQDTIGNKIKDISDIIKDPHNLNGRMYDAFGSGLGQMASGLGQIYSKNISDVDPMNGGSIGQEAGQMGAASNQLQNQVEAKNPIMGELMNMAPKALTTLPLGTSKAAILGGGALLGATTPTITPEQQTQYPTQPMQTAFDRTLAPLGTINQTIANTLQTDPDSTLGKAIQGGLGAGETMGAAKVGGEVLNKVIPDSYDTFLSKNANLDQDALRTKANETYTAAAAAGGNVGADHVNNWVNNALNILPQEEETKRIFGQSKAEGIINNLQTLKDKPLSFKAAQEIDSKLGNAIEDETDPVTGKVNADGQKLIEVRQGLKDTIENIPDQPGFELLNQAKQLWSAQAKAGDIQRILDKASYSDNQATTVKNGFKALATNPSRLRGYTPEEITAIKNAARTGIVTSVLKTAGSRLGSLIAGGVGLAHGGPLGAVAAFGSEHAAGGAARGLADSIQVGKGQAVLDQIAQRPAVQGAFGLKPATPLIPEATQSATAKLATSLVKAQTASTQAQQQFQPKTIKQSPQQQGFADQVKAPDVSSFAKPESSNNPNAKNPNSTASGAFQFTNKTWANMVMKYGKQTGINMADKNNPQAQATMARLYAHDNIDELKPALGRMPTKGELYMAHVFGADGAKKLIQAPADKEAALLFPRNVIDGNHNVFFDKQTKQPRTAAQVYQLLSSRV